MSAIQIVCAVAVPLLWGYQFVAIKVGVMEFPPRFFLALRFLAIALLLVPLVKRPTRQQVGPVAAISIFLGGLNFGLFYVGSGSIAVALYHVHQAFAAPDFDAGGSAGKLASVEGSMPVVATIGQRDFLGTLPVLSNQPHDVLNHGCSR